MKTGIKTIDNLPEKHKIKIHSVSDERNMGDGVWVYLKDEYKDFNFDPFTPFGMIHEQQVNEAVRRLKKDVRKVTKSDRENFKFE